MKLIVWAPNPHGQAWQCGMIHVVDGYELTPRDHRELVMLRVQELADRISSQMADRIVGDLAASGEHAVISAAQIPSHDQMGEGLVENLRDLLVERGALVTHPVVCRAQPDTTQDDWDEMTFETWVANAA